MTDRYNTLTVVLEKSTRDDDAKHLIDAIKMMRNVISVEGNVADIGEYMAIERARRDLGEKILSVIYPKIYGVPRE